jgi:hypothetical protein
LIWSKRLPNIHFIETGGGQIAHIQAMAENDIEIRDGLVFVASSDPNPIPYAIVHQYDRRADLTALFHRLFVIQ